MIQSWKELWELNKLSVKWVAKHWKGYTLALIISYGIGYILGTGGFKNCKTYIENKLKKINKRGGVLTRALSFCAKITFLFMKEVEAMTLIGCALILLGVVLLIRGDNNN